MAIAINPYQDMLKIRRPVLRHTHMDIARRAKIFAPFAALKGFEDCIRAKEIIYVEKPELSEDQKEELDHKLHMLHEGMAVTVSYYNPETNAGRLGRIMKCTGDVDFYYPGVRLRIGDEMIWVEQIVDLEGDVFSCLEEPA